MTDPAIAHALPTRTTPTWEVELLISGVAVFAMLQLPGWLDDLVFTVEPRVDENWRLVAMLFYIYAKSAAIVLAVTFAAHLLLRAQWIALVGMHSVYPGGIRLDRMRMGPTQRAIETARAEPMSASIERADNRASVVFALGVSIATLIVSVCITFCGLLALVTLALLAAGWEADTFKVLLTLFGIGFVPFAAAVTLDQHLAARLPVDGTIRRVLRRVLGAYTRIGMGRRNNLIVATLTSNNGERRMMGVVVGVMMVTLLGVAAGYFVMRSEQPFGSYGYFPEAHNLESTAASYDDQRNPARDRAVPYIQSAVIVGPYLKLVVPYRPRSDEPAMRKRCADVSALQDDALARARLACLQSVRGATLDGSPIRDLRYEISSDPRTDRPALLAMIDVRALAKGRHELRITRPPRAGRERKPDDRDPGYDVIPFWR